MTSPTPERPDPATDQDLVDLAEIEAAPPQEQQWRSMLPAAIIGTTVLLMLRFVLVPILEHNKDLPLSVRIAFTPLLHTAIAAYAIWVVWRHRQRIFERRLRFLDLLLEGVIAFGVWLGVMGANLAIAVVWKLFSGESAGMPQQFEDLVFSHDVFTLVVLGVLACLWAPVSEELFFRRMLLRSLQGRLKLSTALILQATLFTALHDYQGIHVVAIFVLGLALGGLYAWRRTIVSSMMLHAMQNSVATVAMAALMWASARAPVLGIMMENAEQGVRVVRVIPGSGAEEAGLQQDDVITEIRLGGLLAGAAPFEPTPDTGTLRLLLVFQSAGDVVQLRVLRDGDPVDVDVTLQARDDLELEEDDGT